MNGGKTTGLDVAVRDELIPTGEILLRSRAVLRSVCKVPSSAESSFGSRCIRSFSSS